jgi:hypothetical protein
MDNLFEKLKSMGFEYTGKIPTDRGSPTVTIETDTFINHFLDIDLRVLNDNHILLCKPLDKRCCIDMVFLREIAKPFPDVLVEVNKYTSFREEEMLLNLVAESSTDDIQSHLSNMFWVLDEYQQRLRFRPKRYRISLS